VDPYFFENTPIDGAKCQKLNIICNKNFVSMKKDFFGKNNFIVFMFDLFHKKRLNIQAMLFVLQVVISFEIFNH
jgi:hypothetical protein